MYSSIQFTDTHDYAISCFVQGGKAWQLLCYGDFARRGLLKIKREGWESCHSTLLLLWMHRDSKISLADHCSVHHNLAWHLDMILWCKMYQIRTDLELNHINIKAEGLASFLTPNDFPAAPKNLLLLLSSTLTFQSSTAEHASANVRIQSSFFFQEMTPTLFLFNVNHKISSNNSLSFISMT